MLSSEKILNDPLKNELSYVYWLVDSPPVAGKVLYPLRNPPDRGYPHRQRSRCEFPPRPLDPFMSIESVDTLLDVLRRVQLLSHEQAEEIVRELVPHYRDPESLGEHLVEVDWLTAYQLQLLLSGRWEISRSGPTRFSISWARGGERGFQSLGDHARAACCLESAPAGSG